MNNEMFFCSSETVSSELTVSLQKYIFLNINNTKKQQKN
jgi:hypothetical protein